MKYTINLTKQAVADVQRLRKSEPAAYKKYSRLVTELEDHPETGTGKPELLGSDRVGQWSRRITSKHRLIYKIFEEEVIVLVLSTYGHYGEK